MGVCVVGVLPAVAGDGRANLSVEVDVGAKAAEELLHALYAVLEPIDVGLWRSAGFRCLPIDQFYMGAVRMGSANTLTHRCSDG